MVLGAAVDQCVKEKSSGGEIDNRRASDASGIKTSARGGWDGRTKIGARPNREASRGIKRIDIVLFRHGNDHWSTRTALDIKRLSVNGAGDCAIEVEIARQVGRR